MTTKTLDVQTAEVTTAAVEVKTLTIRGKQVTLAVFRQLEDAELITDDGHLAGVPWGRVNYHPDKCADGPKHMHVVWQDGVELRRSTVRSSFHAPAGSPEVAGEFVERVLADELLGQPTSYFKGELTKLMRERLLHSSSWFGFSLASDSGQKMRIEVDFEEFSEDLKSLFNWRSPSRGDEQVEAVRKLYDGWKSADEYWSEVVAWVDAEAQRRDRQRRLRETLAELPQLFIAV